MKRYALAILALLLISYASPFQNQLSDTRELQDIAQVNSSVSATPQMHSFNGSIPTPDRMHTTRLNLDYGSCFSSAQNSNSPAYQDYLQTDNGSYFVLGSSQTNAILNSGKTTAPHDALLMHFDADGTCINSNSYEQKVTNNLPWTAASTVKPYTNTNWHNTGAHTLIGLDDDWLVVAGTLGYNTYDYSSWGDVINSTSITSTSQVGEHIFLAKISRSNLTIGDWEILPARDSHRPNDPCKHVGVYPQTFSNSTEFALAVNLYCDPSDTSSTAKMDISGTTYSVNFCGNGGMYEHCRYTNFMVRFSHNLSIIDSTEIPSPHGDSGNIMFLDDGTIVALDGYSWDDSDILARYQIPGQQWSTIDPNLDCDFTGSFILALDNDRFGWLCAESTSSTSSELILSIVNTSTANYTEYYLGEFSAPQGCLEGGGVAITSDRILHHIFMGSDSLTLANGSTYYGALMVHINISTLNLTIIPDPLGSYGFKEYSSGTSCGAQFDPIRKHSDPNVRSVDASVGQSLVFQTKDTELLVFEIDYDEDGSPDRKDAFPNDPTQNADSDSDGFGDSPTGNNPDDCPYLSGNSTIDLQGCPDNDGDGVSNQGDEFPNDGTQVSDFDSDGYGDNLNGTFGDVCPYTYGESTRDRYGCPDVDFDGWSDENDIFPQDSSQWGDWDGDGFGDQLNGVEGDSCPIDPGNSTKDRYGCIDSDGDGWSDDGDDLPQNPTQWSDRDGDGYGDNQEENATMSDTFPADGTQWNDTDEDGHGDNPFGTQGDWFPDDPTRWQDSDQDGIADEDDAFPNEKSQTMDTDGDGYGDDANGSNPDAFPNDAGEWSDTDGDGIGNNADAFPFDPSQQTDSDGDGFGDNERGSGADKFPSDSTQWADIDGDGYGDNAEGMNPDAFITDPTQWADTDGDGYGDNPTGRLADAFIEDATQWIDVDEDGFGDNQSGNNPDPFLLDFDNDGYNDSIDPLPKLASPGDLDNDGVLDEEDLFPEDFREWADNDGDGVGDNADTDDDNDGWSDADELRDGTDPFSSSEQPVDSFEIVIPGTAVGLGAWDLIGIFGGVPLFIWIGFGFITRNGRTAKYEEKLRTANTRDELESVARQWEYSLMLRMLGPHQGIRLERLRAELDDVFERQNQTLSSLEQSEYNQTQLVQDEMKQNEKQVPEINLKPDIDAVGNPDGNGYEWITAEDGKNWYRLQGTKDDWVEFSS